MKSQPQLTVLLLAAILIAPLGCNAIKGVGRDIQALAESSQSAIQHAAGSDRSNPTSPATATSENAQTTALQPEVYRW